MKTNKLILILVIIIIISGISLFVACTKDAENDPVQGAFYNHSKEQGTSDTTQNDSGYSIFAILIHRIHESSDQERKGRGGMT